MSRDNEFINEDLIDLGDVTVETQGTEPPVIEDDISGFHLPA